LKGVKNLIKLTGKKILTGVMALIIMLCMVSVAFGAPDNSSNNIKSVDQRIQETQYFRNLFGLKNDLQTVKNIVATNDISKKYGVVLTQDEVSQLDQRIGYQENHKQDLLNYIRSVDGFAWSYIAQKQGGVFHVGLKTSTQSLDNVINKAKAIYGKADLVQFDTARYTEAELSQLADKIRSQMNEISTSQGITIQKIAVNIPEQRLDVQITPYTPQSIDTLNNIFPKDEVAYQQIEVVNLNARNTPNTPLQGGLQIAKTSSTAAYCTSGFMGKIGTTDYLVTAGHCTTSTSDTIYQGGSFIGFTSGSHQGGNNDSAVINIPSSLASKYVYGASSQSNTLTSAESVSGEVIGEAVCLAGNVSGYACGTLRYNNVTDTFGTTYVYDHIRQADHASASGDSGGTIFSGSSLKGVHFAGSGGAPGVPYASYYSHVSAILSQWGMTF
jgi:hypothetical protein